MSADLTPYIYKAGDPYRSEVALGQMQNEPAAHNDCVVIGGLNALNALGYPYVDPQEVINWEASQGYVDVAGDGGTQFWWLWAFCQQDPRFPNLPTTYGTNLLDDITNALNLGYPVLFFAKVDCATVLFSPAGGCGHCSNWCCVEDAANSKVLNTWSNELQQYSNDVLLGAMYGAIVIQRSVFPAPPPPPPPPPIPLWRKRKPVEFRFTAADATPDNPFSVSSPCAAADRRTNWNITMIKAAGDAHLEVFSWAPDGTPYGAVDVTVSGNEPLKRGPVPAFGDSTTVGIKTPDNGLTPFTLGVSVKDAPSGAEFVLVLHDEA